MGNHTGVPYKPLPKEDSTMTSTDIPLSTKLDTDDPLSMSLEMEPSHQMNRESNRYKSNYSRFRNSIKGIRLNIKFAIGLLLVLMGILIGIALKSGFTSPPPIPNYLFASKEDLEDLQHLVNESLKNLVQQLKDGDKQNRNHIQQLQNKISDIEKQSNSSQFMQDSRAKATSDQLSKLQGYVDSLNKEIHRPVNLYKDCTKDTKSCSIDPSKSRDYWRDCATLRLPLNKEDWKTIHYQCKYHSSLTENMEVLTPFEDNGHIRCDCDVILPGDNSQPHRPVSNDIHATCTLAILRCPLSQYIFE